MSGGSWHERSHPSAAAVLQSPQPAATRLASLSHLLIHSANVLVCMTMLIERAVPTLVAICLVISQTVTSNLINQTDKCSGVVAAFIFFFSFQSGNVNPKHKPYLNRMLRRGILISAVNLNEK